jgi:hypothetical protein
LKTNHLATLVVGTAKELSPKKMFRELTFAKKWFAETNDAPYLQTNLQIYKQIHKQMMQHIYIHTWDF